MDLKNNDNKNMKKNSKENNNDIKTPIENANENNPNEEDVYFYIMTLQAGNERHQIKIYQNSDASELAFNFCKTYNLDFPTMKYLKKYIKQIIANFNNIRKNEMIYLLKDNSSIQEVAEEEIITDNSLKNSETFKKNNSNIVNINNEENHKSKKSSPEKNINNEENNTKSTQKEKEGSQNIEKKFNIIDENEILKFKNILEDDGQIELKDYSIDYCLENDSVEVFSPTEQTTKIEQHSSLKNSSSLNQRKNCDNQEKKKNKNNKLQINNNINFNKNNKKQNYIFDLNKIKREKNKTNEINTEELKNILIHFKELNSKDKKIRSKEKKCDVRNFIKKNNYMQFNKKPKSLERIKKKENNRTTISDNNNKSKELAIKNSFKINEYEKNLKNMNEIKPKYFSNYYDYFLKSKNFRSPMVENNSGYKFHINRSINQDSNISRSISHHKRYNMTQKISMKNKRKKEKSMMDLNTLNTLNHQKMNTEIKFNLNKILKKENNSRDKQKTVLKNKIKPKYNIICNSNNNFNNCFNKTINGRCHTSRSKIKNINGQELFMESRKIKSNGIKKMVTESLLNIHKFKVPSLENKRNINVNGRVIRALKSKSKHNQNCKTRELFSRNESNIEKSVNLYEQLYYESGINNNVNTRNKRNITDVNIIHRKTSFRSECKKNY